MSKDETSDARHRLRAVPRGGSKVRFLELFFDLVFVLAFIQCTTLMVEQPTWAGVVRGLFVLAVLWWSWVGYSWLTSVVDPEEGTVRIAMLAATAALLVVTLAIPEAFGDLGLLFAVAYGLVRVIHLGLFALASRDDPQMRTSVVGLAISSGIGVSLLGTAAFLDGVAQGALWGIAILIDFIGPAVFGSSGWRLEPAHFAERHGLIIILALGESIIALGFGAEHGLTAGVLVAAVLGVAVACALWWIYFDVVALVTERRLTRAAAGRERNDLARNSYSYLHFPMVAGISLASVGLETTVAHVDEHLHTVPAFALLGGLALYLLAHTVLRLYNAHSINYPRFALAVLLLALVPVARQLPAVATLGGVTVLLWALITFETTSYGEERTRVRRGLLDEPPPEHL